MRAMHIDRIDRAMVTFAFRAWGKWLRAGTVIGHDELARMPVNNRNALLDKGFLYAWPKEAGPMAISKPKPITVDEREEKLERYVIARGFRGNGQYDVIEGRRINDEPLSKEAATALVEAGT